MKTTFKVGRNKPNKQKIYFSNPSTTQFTLEAWTGGNSFKLLWELELFGFRFCLWRSIN